MVQYKVTGMSCAACSARVEKAVSRVEGVTQCSVSLLTNSMGVDGVAQKEDVIAAVEAAGYGASLLEQEKQSVESMLRDETILIIQKRLGVSIAFLLLLMYFSMGYMMFDFPVGKLLQHNMAAIGTIQGILAFVVMVINRQFFISGSKSLLHGAPNMDTLVSLGSGAAFVYSLISLIMVYVYQMEGNMGKTMEYAEDFYFESAAMILTLITVGKLLEAKSKGKTTDAIRSLLELSPQTATVCRGETEQTIPVEEVRINDIYIVRPGEQIPVDGVVLDGSSAVNEASLSGESIPVDKAKGDWVYQGTINSSGYLRCKALKVGEDTTLAQIIRLVSDASATKAPIAKVADRVSGVFVPVVIGIALFTFCIWLLHGVNLSFALARSISVLVISCPCALGLATPVAIMVGNGVGAKNGIMFKTAASLEETGKADIVVLDKTGTVTEGKPRVTEIIKTGDECSEDWLSIAYSLEKNSEHPLAYAIREYCMEQRAEAKEVTEFRVLPGNGLQGVIDGKMTFAGNQAFIEKRVELSEQEKDIANRMAAKGQTPIFFAREKQLLGMMAVADSMKADSKEAITELQNLGMMVVMLTGDHELTAKAISEASGVDHFIAGVLPEGKEKVVSELKKYGKVIMVGDGINDAPALTSADMGIAIGAGADVAIDAADVVLMKSSLRDVAGAIKLSRATLRNIHENLFWAFFYNCIGIPLAAGIFIPILSWQMNPMFGAAAMSLSSFFVVSNALRLNFYQVQAPGKPKKRTLSQETRAGIKAMEIKSIHEKGEKIMTKTMKIEGMMCGHCEARVKKVLEALPQVSEAEVSHEKGTAVVTLSEALSDDCLKKTVEEQDYKVISIE